MARKRDIPPEFTDAARGVRLHKALADAGVASRREAESLIAEGRVRVNGKIVKAMPAWIDPATDRIEVDGQGVARKRPGQSERRRLVYIALHKPRHVISTTKDPEGRRTVVDLVDLPAGVKARLYPVGRLDAESTGLILLTNDGDLANHLTHPSYEVAKQYVVSVRGRLDDTAIAKLKDGLYLAHQKATARDSVKVKKASMVKVKLQGYTRDRRIGDRTQLHVTLREGQNREIRRLLARVGHKVRRLQRVGIGPLKLKGIASGEWRMLTGKEINALYKAAGLERLTDKEATQRRGEKTTKGTKKKATKKKGVKKKGVKKKATKAKGTKARRHGGTK